MRPRIGINYHAYIDMVRRLEADESIPADEFIRFIDESIEESTDREFEFSERIAIQQEQFYDGKTPVQRALECFNRAERFPSEHECARKFLRDVAPHVVIFQRKTSA